MRHVGAERQREAALAGDDVRGLLGGGEIDVDAEHFRALARAGDRGRLAVAPAGADRARADDERDLVLEAIRHGSLLVDWRIGYRRASWLISENRIFLRLGF